MRVDPGKELKEVAGEQRRRKNLAWDSEQYSNFKGARAWIFGSNCAPSVRRVF